jgi:hypothetical protein
MTKSAARSPFAAIVFVLSTWTAIAQELPTLDVAPLCRAEGKAAPDFAASCLADEKKARDELARQWATYTRDNKVSCLRLATGIPGVQSYVELLTCLQTNKDVQGLPKR